MNIKTQLIVMKMFITGVCFLFQKKAEVCILCLFTAAAGWLVQNNFNIFLKISFDSHTALSLL